MNDMAAINQTGPILHGRVVSCLIEQSWRRDDHNAAVKLALSVKKRGRTVFFVGNGGSAAIASHMAADFQKAARVAAQCFNDPAQLTCIANDLGYENAFATPLSYHGKPGDLLVAISSSGQSKSILDAVDMARMKEMNVITLSGFKPDNPLRGMGDVNFYVSSDRYGTVEVCHHAICHQILDSVIDAS